VAIVTMKTEAIAQLATPMARTRINASRPGVDGGAAAGVGVMLADTNGTLAIQ
jgi:hypothetical protein